MWLKRPALIYNNDVLKKIDDSVLAHEVSNVCVEHKQRVVVLVSVQFLDGFGNCSGCELLHLAYTFELLRREECSVVVVFLANDGGHAVYDAFVQTFGIERG